MDEFGCVLLAWLMTVEAAWLMTVEAAPRKLKEAWVDWSWRSTWDNIMWTIWPSGKCHYGRGGPQGGRGGPGAWAISLLGPNRPLSSPCFSLQMASSSSLRPANCAFHSIIYYNLPWSWNTGSKQMQAPSKSRLYMINWSLTRDCPSKEATVYTIGYQQRPPVHRWHVQ